MFQNCAAYELRPYATSAEYVSENQNEVSVDRIEMTCPNLNSVSFSNPLLPLLRGISSS